jgi:hypothetical protein
MKKVNVGFNCPDNFIVGIGMDVAFSFRKLALVGIVRGDAEQNEKLRPTISCHLLRKSSS